MHGAWVPTHRFLTNVRGLVAMQHLILNGESAWGTKIVKESLKAFKSLSMSNGMYININPTNT
jgi:hypothetical protein